jgi:short-subunit dehydrogenase
LLALLIRVALNNPQKLKQAVQGKIVLITGASFGIGEETAKHLAKQGAIVLMVARSFDKLQAVATQIIEQGGVAYTYTCDLSQPEAAKKLASDILEQHGHVDILLNNAGKSIRRSIGMSLDRFQDFERTMAINYLGPVQLILALLPSMRARKKGHIINISTWGVKMPAGGRWSAYQASKGAFDTWFKSVSVEVKQDGISTTSIYPAIVYTRMSAPTPWMHLLPGMTTDDAAHVVERAIVEKPYDISPPWLWSAQVSAVLMPTPVRKYMELVFKLTSDSEASLSSAKSSIKQR